ncbi:MAG: hypothetical protein ACK41R_08650 [Thermus sp.]
MEPKVPKKVFAVGNLSVYAGPWESWREVWEAWPTGSPGYFLALAPEKLFPKRSRPPGDIWVAEGERLRIPSNWNRAQPLPAVSFNGPENAEGIAINWCDMKTPPLSRDDWEWIADTLRGLAGNLYVGCRAGLGRTGTALAILAGLWCLTETPIAYVREHYLEEAVETRDQVEYVARITGFQENVRGSRG